MLNWRNLSYVFAIVWVSGWAACQATDPFSHKLVVQHDIIVPNSVAEGFIYPVFDGVSDSPIWGIFHGEAGRFQLYDVDSQTLITELYLPAVQAAPHQFQGSLSHRDTFLLLDLDNHHLLKLTHMGDTASIWQLPFQWNEFGAITFNALVPTPINVVDHTYFLSIRSIEWDFNDPTGGMYKAPLFFAANGADPQQHTTLGTWPEYVKDPDHFALDMMPKMSRPRGDTVFYSFFSDPHIYAIDLLQLKTTAAYLPADAFTNFTALQLTNLQDISATSTFGVENSLYGGLSYDPYRDVLYRIVLHALPLVRKDGMENLIEDKPWSIQIIDAATLEEIGESEIPNADTYLPRAIYPTPEGILIQKRSKTSPADGDSTFTLFALSQ